ncbi:MAG TPA: hypothetical protein ENJ09_00895 [Planctomycetes bacterium]|nr:hypothetical protein [Planctomycetota bacterium]
MSLRAPHFPIVYLRGFAATMGEIEDTVSTPYMGFNLGSTKIRQDFENRVRRFIFESPLLRLMKDEGYVDAFRNGDFPPPETRVPARSVWVFRYYEKDSKSLGDGKRDEIEDYAADLEAFLERIRDQVAGDDAAERKRFRVHLVAHSMGGLIVRSFLQRTRRGKPALVDKVYTYGTPHGGIEVAGHDVPDLGRFDRLRIGNFNPARMREFLGLDADADVRSLDGAFPPERFFCFVGTNYRDYAAAGGMAKKLTGPFGDGLVLMKNAVVTSAPRAFAHRSHSGPFGLVNSEEGYQNLRRFLFGNWRVEGLLAVDELTLPKRVEKKKRDGHRIRASYNIELGLSVRGGGVRLSERRVSQASALRKSYERLRKDPRPVHLFTTYLHEGARMRDSGDRALAFALELGVEVPVFEVDQRFWFDGHFEGAVLWRDTLSFELRTGGSRMSLRYGLVSRSGVGVANRRVTLTEPDAAGTREVEIPVGFPADTREARKPRPGLCARLLLRISPWEEVA